MTYTNIPCSTITGRNWKGNFCDIIDFQDCDAERIADAYCIDAPTRIAAGGTRYSIYNKNAAHALTVNRN